MTSFNPKSALVALSGGVDSSVCVKLLQDSGLHVEAAVIEFSPAHRPAVEAARANAQALGVRLHVVRCHEEFSRHVIDCFAESYRSGRTPNPCIVCNPLVKFNQIVELADSLGLEAIATGHYAETVRCGERWALRRARCLPRDQSYMLYRLGQDALSRLLLPLSALSKDAVRTLARGAGLPCSEAPDSQEICFIPDGDYARFIEERYGPCPPGDFISPEGVPCGRHRGILHYTVGQRKGLGVALGRPVFIRRIDPATGNIELGEAADAFFPSAAVSDCVYLPFEEPAGPMKVTVKIRSQARPAAARVTPLEGRRALVEFAEPQRAPAPGQSCVFYDGDLVVGGGFLD